MVEQLTCLLKKNIATCGSGAGTSGYLWVGVNILGQLASLQPSRTPIRLVATSVRGVSGADNEWNSVTVGKCMPRGNTLRAVTPMCICRLTDLSCGANPSYTASVEPLIVIGPGTQAP